jgi:hypothetical protein
MGRTPSWTTEEDAIVLKMFPTAAARLLPHRSRGAIAQHRFHLQHPDQKGDWGNWTPKEDAILKRLWPTANHVAELLPRFPKRNAIQLRNRAAKLGVKRKYLGDHNARLSGHKEVLDQIVVRAKEDGIAIYKLDQILQTGTYFSKAHYREQSKPVNLKAVAKAVEFFGGTLVIDWRDR